MKRTMRWVGVVLVFSLSLGVAGVQAQQPVAAEPQAPSGTVQAPREVVPPLPVPRLVKFAGVLKDELGKPRTGVVGVTFAIYKEQESGAALWLETQNVELDEQGRYTVLLGSTKSEGLPLELFTAGEPRWLGVQVNLPKELEQPRVLLVSVPYALKASDADTLGGKPASVYLTTEQAGGGGTTGKPQGSAGIISSAVSGTGSTNVVPKWLDNVGTLGNSQITDDGTNVNMPGNVGALAYKFTGNAAAPTDATATIFNQAFVGPVFSGLSFKVRTGAPVPADALSIDQSQNVSIAGNASALAYKFTGNAAAPTDATATIFNQAFVGPVFSGLSFKVRTGEPVPADALSIDQSQNVSVVKGNLMLSGAGNAIVFSDGTVQSTAVKGTGGGTITGVSAGTGLTGGGMTGGVNLAINPAVVPQLGAGSNTFTGSITASSFNGSGGGLTNVNAAMLGGNPPSAFATTGANSFIGNQSIMGNLSLTGTLALPNTSSATAGVITLGGTSFAHSFGTQNTFVGSGAGNFTSTGVNNTANGFQALLNNTTGFQNTASGAFALQSNTTGSSNTASGASALGGNTTGNNNTASGIQALALNTTGSNNTASGLAALVRNTVGNSNTASGSGALALNTTGFSNTAVGQDAGVTAMSANANTIGSNNTFIGFSAGPGTPTQLNNAAAIGANALVNCNNCIVLGDSTMPMSVGIGTTTPSQKLEVAGNLKISGAGNALVFADGTVQTTAGAGAGGGTITGVTAGAGLAGGGTAGGVTLAINPSVVPQLGATSNTFTGSIAASSFSGSGTGLTNVNAAMLNGLASNAFAQLAANNTFVGTQSINNGNLALPNTTGPGGGTITLAGGPFIHDCCLSTTYGLGTNTFIGIRAGNFTSTGGHNTASGDQALGLNTTGDLNTASGSLTLFRNTTGTANTASGYQALANNATGSNNTGLGADALFNSTGSSNSAFGSAALQLLTSGSSNIAIGALAGTNLMTGSSNIYIGADSGASSESNTLRIGTTGTQTATFMAGISGVTSASGVAVFVNPSGQLGTTTSSRQFKNQIADMGGESDLLMKLRPVAFYYKPEYDDTRTRQYGLVAEEVAQVAPQLVVFDKDGAPQTVRYHFVNAMLLNEVQKQRQLVEEQKETITRQQAEIRGLAARLAKLEALLAPHR